MTKGLATPSGRSYLAAYPSPESLRELKAKLRRMVGSHMSWQNEENLAHDVNRVLRGWTNYFSYGTPAGSRNRAGEGPER